MDNETLLYSGSRRVPGLFMIKADGTGNRMIFRGSLYTVPDLSPDGRKLCFLGAEMDVEDITRMHLVVLDLATGRRVPPPPDEIAGARWRR